MPPRKPPAPQPEEPNGPNQRAQMVLVTVGASIVALIVVTALFGPAEKSARAFQLLAMWK